jgi:hypothetical protein
MSSIDDSSSAILLQTQTRHVLLVTQSLFFLVLAWCLILNHSATAENDGISFYGVHRETVALLIGGYAAAFVGLWITSTHFKAAGVPTLTWVGLRVIAILLFVLLASPYDRGPFLNWIHMIAGILGAVIQLEVALQLVRESRSASRSSCSAEESPRLRCRTGISTISCRARSSSRSAFRGASSSGRTLSPIGCGERRRL